MLSGKEIEINLCTKVNTSSVYVTKMDKGIRVNVEFFAKIGAAMDYTRGNIMKISVDVK